MQYLEIFSWSSWAKPFRPWSIPPASLLGMLDFSGLMTILTLWCASFASGPRAADANQAHWINKKTNKSYQRNRTISRWYIDPIDRPTPTSNDHCFHACRPYVRPHFSKSSETTQIFTAGRVVGWPRGSLITSVWLRFGSTKLLPNIAWTSVS